MTIRFISALLTAVPVFAAAAAAAPAALAADYVIDAKGMHASVNFRVKHLGYSWLTGRFDSFSGAFSFDAENPEASSVEVEIDAASVNSNHAQRDNHLRSPDFLDVKKHPKASFKSTGVKVSGDTARVTGDLTLRGVTKSVVIDAEFIGEGPDPWGGHRAGFAGKTSFAMADFGINYNLGPASRIVELDLHIEGVRR